MSETVRILGVIEESRDTKTFEFQWDARALPGQFVMVWVPGMDEIPMSLSCTGRIKTITVKAVGEATRRMHELRIGDSMRIRGPFGNGFTLTKGKKTLIVGGGFGTAAVMPAVRETGADTIIAARTRDEIIMDAVAAKYARNVWMATDDGSLGFHGNAVQLVKETIVRNRYETVLACGPEIMLYHLYKVCMEAGLNCQLSMERYMKCGEGLCGCCVMDDQRVCRDGPVFSRDQITAMKDFGTRKRDECGRPVEFRW
jgi:dihydroorotate dehydrogenase electron transfer subunit